MARRRGSRRGRAKGAAYRERLIINGNANLVAGTTGAVTVFTATVPCRFTHKMTRGNIQANAAGTSPYACALVKVPQGYTANSLSLTATNPLYQPEENVMSFVSGIIGGAASVTDVQPCIADTLRGGSCFLQVGDTVQYVQLSSAVAATSFWTVDFSVSS